MRVAWAPEPQGRGAHVQRSSVKERPILVGGAQYSRKAKSRSVSLTNQCSSPGSHTSITPGRSWYSTPSMYAFPSP